MGLLKAAERYPLNDVINGDNAHGCYTWKRIGEFHYTGKESRTVGNARYGTGDTISFDIDMDARTMVCNKNGEDLYTYEEIPEEAMFTICFGGSDQHITITDVEVGGTSQEGSTQVSGKRLVAKGDTVYYHFPVNAGYFYRNSLRWLRDNTDKVEISPDTLVLKKTTDDNTVQVQTTGIKYYSGRYYFEIEFVNVPAGSLAVVGFVPHITNTDNWNEQAKFAALL
jgi:hypothetical protein